MAKLNVLRSPIPADGALLRSDGAKILPMIGELVTKTLFDSKVRQVKSKLFETIKKPLYNGEAERWLLDPLISASNKMWTNYTPGFLNEMLFRKSLTYALLSEYYLLHSQRDLANAMNLQAVINQPLFQSLVMGSAAYPEFAEEFNIVEGTKMSIKTETTGKAKFSEPKAVRPFSILWQALPLFFKNSDTLGAFGKYLKFSLDPFQMGSEGFDPTKLDTELQVSNSLLLTVSRQGKGMHLWGEDRKKRVDLLYYIMTTIETLGETGSDAVRSKPQVIKDSKATEQENFYEAYSMLCLLDKYLTSIENYDAEYPKAPFQPMSVAWIMSQESSARQLAAMYASTIRLVPSLTIADAWIQWQESVRFYEPQLTYHIKYSKFDQLMKDTDGIVKKLLDSNAYTAIETIYSKVKAETGVDFLLPPAHPAIARGESLLATTELEALAVTTGGKFTLKPNVEAVRSYSPASTISYLPWEGASDMLVLLMDQLESFNVLLTMLGRSDAILDIAIKQMGMTSPVDIPVEIDEINLSKYQYKDFERASIYTPKLDKWIPADTNQDSSSVAMSLRPHFYPWLYQPIIVPLYLRYCMDSARSIKWSRTYKGAKYDYLMNGVADPYYYIWPKENPSPSGDLATLGFQHTLLPACMTLTRNRNVIDYSWANYLTRISGAAPDFSSEQLMKRAADILTVYYSKEDDLNRSYATVILDAMAGNVFVYRAQLATDEKVDPISGVGLNLDSSRDWEWLQPEIPAVWGVPTRAFAECTDGWALAGNNKLSGVTPFKDKLVGYTADGSYIYAFILHNIYPKAEPMTYVPYRQRRDVMIQVPVRISVINSIATSNPVTLPSDAVKYKVEDVKFLVAKVPAWTDAAAISELTATNINLGKTHFLPAIGWSGMAEPWAHIIWSHQLSIVDEQVGLWSKYRFGSVFTFLYDKTRDLVLRAKRDFEVEILDLDEFEAAYRESDPVIMPGSADPGSNLTEFPTKFDSPATGFLSVRTAPITAPAPSSASPKDQLEKERLPETETLAADVIGDKTKLLTQSSPASGDPLEDSDSIKEFETVEASTETDEEKKKRKKKKLEEEAEALK